MYLFIERDVYHPYTEYDINKLSHYKLFVSFYLVLNPTENNNKKKTRKINFIIKVI